MAFTTGQGQPVITLLMILNGISMAAVPIGAIYVLESADGSLWWSAGLGWPFVSMWLQGRLSYLTPGSSGTQHVGWSDPGSGGGPGGWAGP
jgi:hypothetical protein